MPGPLTARLLLTLTLCVSTVFIATVDKAVAQAPEAQSASAEQSQPLTPEQALNMYAAEGINFQKGPLTGDLGVAKIKLGPEWLYLDGGQTAKLMSLYGNQVTGMEQGLIARADDPEGYFAVFEFDAMGYIEDADESDLDAEAMLKSFKASDKDQNVWRKEQGMPPLNTVGWKTPPHYDAATNNLEWCLELESEGVAVLNHNIRVLGRKGVMVVTLVCVPEALDSALSEVHAAMDDYHFDSGESYKDYQPGDMIAKYGLAALVTGGGLAVAAKTGLLGKLLKPILIGGAVVIGVFAKFFKKIFGGFAKEV